MIGQTISHYKVLEKIGQGGMGEEDTNLSREVAIKVLPEQFTQDPQRLARFEREAKLLASLNHPNIAAIYGLEEADGVRFLALELVPGETLAERVAKGPVPVEEALEICRQIAEGVEAAHEKGVIHRDLKPANVKVTPQGKVKILDFGLAKAFEDQAPVTDISQSPTLTEEMTRAGVILGTAAYMSPEQAKGKPVDKRADVFAFGAVLYELLTGKRAFEGETITETLAKILEGEPNWAALPDTTPLRIKELLQDCLQKEVHNRVHDVSQLRIQINKALKEPTTVSPTGVGRTAQPSPWKVAILWSIAVVAVVVALSMAFWPSPPPESRLSMQFVIIPPSTAPLRSSPGRDLVISPDGRRIAYAAIGGNSTQLYVRSLDGVEATPIAGTEGTRSTAFFSPNGESIAFLVEGQLKKVSLSAGPAMTLTEVVSTAGMRGGSWGPDDTIVFAGLYGADTPGSREGLFRVSAAGGELETLALVDSEKGETEYRQPEVLPGGQALLFTIERGDGNFQIAVLSLETGERKVVLEGGRLAHYAPTGHLVYATAVGGTLMAAPFDLARLEVTGDPVPILERVRSAAGSGVDYSFSSDGTLVYVEGEGGGQVNPGKPVWVDRDGGGVESIVEDILEFPRYPRISPDGRRLAMTIGQGNAGDLWVYNLGGQPPYPLALEGGNGWPVWTPDGEKVAFGSGVGNSLDLVWIPADGSTLDPEPLFENNTGNQFPEAWTPDGQELLFVQLGANRANDIMAVSPNGSEPRLVVQTQHSDSSAARGGVAVAFPGWSLVGLCIRCDG